MDTCSKCGGGLKPLFTSMYCPRCDNKDKQPSAVGYNKYNPDDDSLVLWECQGCNYMGLGPRTSKGCPYCGKPMGSLPLC